MIMIMKPNMKRKMKRNAVSFLLAFVMLLSLFPTGLVTTAEAATSEYKIVFDANGGTGNVPATISNSGTDSSVVMGDIKSFRPTLEGFDFMGWSAS